MDSKHINSSQYLSSSAAQSASGNFSSATTSDTPTGENCDRTSDFSAPPNIYTRECQIQTCRIEFCELFLKPDFSEAGRLKNDANRSLRSRTPSNAADVRGDLTAAIMDCIRQTIHTSKIQWNALIMTKQWGT
jgi:hypothetical protein